MTRLKCPPYQPHSQANEGVTVSVTILEVFYRKDFASRNASSACNPRNKGIMWNLEVAFRILRNWDRANIVCSLKIAWY